METGDRRPVPWTAGASIFGALLVGLGGLIFAVLAAVEYDYVGAGMCLVPSALAFGLLANAVFRR